MYSKGQSTKAPDILHDAEPTHHYSYNLGVVLFELYAGRVFDYACDEIDSLEAPNEMKDLLKNLTAEDKNKRRSMKEMMKHPFLKSSG